MSEELKEKFKSEMDQCDWSMLAEHHKKEVVFLVSQNLDLIDVACSVALDDVANVKKWQDSQELRRPSQAEVESFEKDSHQKMANFLIVAPFVLIKLLN